MLRPAVVAAADLRPPGVLEVQGIEVPIDGSLVHASLKNTVDWCAVPAFADSWVNQPERCRETTVKIIPIHSTKKYSIRDVFSAFGNQWTSINAAVTVGANPSASLHFYPLDLWPLILRLPPHSPHTCLSV